MTQCVAGVRGFKACWQRIQAALADELEIIIKLVGLRLIPISQCRKICNSFYKNSGGVLPLKQRADFNFDFFNSLPASSQHIPCLFGGDRSARQYNKEQAMFEAIQKGYYFQAQNPSDISTLVRFTQPNWI